MLTLTQHSPIIYLYIKLRFDLSPKIPTWKHYKQTVLKISRIYTPDFYLSFRDTVFGQLTPIHVYGERMGPKNLWLSKIRKRWKNKNKTEILWRFRMGKSDIFLTFWIFGSLNSLYPDNFIHVICNTKSLISFFHFKQRFSTWQNRETFQKRIIFLIRLLFYWIDIVRQSSSFILEKYWLMLISQIKSGYI